MEKARVRAMDWLKMRWNYGYIEFNSEVYYKEDVGALINLIDFDIFFNQNIYKSMNYLFNFFFNHLYTLPISSILSVVNSSEHF